MAGDWQSVFFFIDDLVVGSQAGDRGDIQKFAFQREQTERLIELAYQRDFLGIAQETRLAKMGGSLYRG